MQLHKAFWFPEHNPMGTVPWVINVQAKMYLFIFQFTRLYLEILDLGNNQDSFSTQIQK